MFITVFFIFFINITNCYFWSKFNWRCLQKSEKGLITISDVYAIKTETKQFYHTLQIFRKKNERKHLVNTWKLYLIEIQIPFLFCLTILFTFILSHSKYKDKSHYHTSWFFWSSFLVFSFLCLRLGLFSWIVGHVWVKWTAII